MDVSSPSIPPRVVADLRPAADAAATARIDRPASALVQGPVIAPASLAQEGLVTRGLMETPAPFTVDPPARSGDAPKRVLKPWGIPMLPSEDRREREAADRTGARLDGESSEVPSADAFSGPRAAFSLPELMQSTNAFDRALRGTATGASSGTIAAIADPKDEASASPVPRDESSYPAA